MLSPKDNAKVASTSDAAVAVAQEVRGSHEKKPKANHSSEKPLLGVGNALPTKSLLKQIISLRLLPGTFPFDFV